MKPEPVKPGKKPADEPGKKPAGLKPSPGATIGGGGDSGNSGGSGGAGGESHEDRINRHLAQIKAILDADTAFIAAQRKGYYAAAKEVFGRMTPKAMRHFDKGVKGYHFYKSQGDVSVAAGEPAAAFYDPNDSSLHLDGTESKTGRLAILYAHEFAHGIDGPKDTFSGSKKWREVWKKEMGKGQLGQNAASSPSEGWADFGAALLGLRASALLTKKLKDCLKFWRDKGLWHATK